MIRHAIDDIENSDDMMDDQIDTISADGRNSGNDNVIGNAIDNSDGRRLTIYDDYANLEVAVFGETSTSYIKCGARPQDIAHLCEIEADGSTRRFMMTTHLRRKTLYMTPTSYEEIYLPNADLFQALFEDAGITSDVVPTDRWKVYIWSERSMGILPWKVLIEDERTITINGRALSGW